MKITLLRYRISAVLKTIRFPIEYLEITESLKKKGFEITAPSLPPAPPGMRMEVSGAIARKGGCQVLLNPDRKIVSYEGSPIDEVTREFDELLTLIKEDFDVSDKDIDFYEIFSEFTVKPAKSALEIVKGLRAEKLYDEVSMIIGKNVCPYILSLVPADGSPRDKNWLDIRLTPDPAVPERFVVEAVFRQESKEEVFSFAKKVEALVQNLIKLCEGWK